MAVGLFERYLSVLKELHQGRLADPQEVCRFLSREKQALRGDHGRLALLHRLDHLAKDLVDLPEHSSGLATDQMRAPQTAAETPIIK